MVFLKKEFMEYSRKNKLLILGILSLMFALMNVVIAKVTPKLFEMLADSIKESGLVVEKVEVTAFTCWEQYYKNLPMLILVFLLLSAAAFSGEYARGTLLLVITKGYPKRSIYFAKTVMLAGTYTAVSLIYFGVTWFYSGFYWDNSVLHDPLRAALYCYIFGLFLVAILVFFSSILKETTGIMAATGAVFIVIYLLSIVPKLKKYLPVKLMEAGKILNGSIDLSEFNMALAVTLVFTLVLFLAGGYCFVKGRICSE